MLVLSIVVASAFWLIYDGNKRGMREGPLTAWAVSVLLLLPVVGPLYYATRPLLPGEVREGGVAWNFLKNLALVWTLLVAASGFSSCAGMSQVVRPGMSDAEVAGAGIGVVLGMGFLFVIWFVPVLGALVLGLLLRQTSVVERG